MKKRKLISKNADLVLLSDEMIAEVETVDKEISVSVINNNLNAMLDYYDCTKTTAVKINNWLVNEGFLKQKKQKEAILKF